MNTLLSLIISQDLIVPWRMYHYRVHLAFCAKHGPGSLLWNFHDANSKTDRHQAEFRFGPWVPGRTTVAGRRGLRSHDSPHHERAARCGRESFFRFTNWFNFFSKSGWTPRKPVVSTPHKQPGVGGECLLFSSLFLLPLPSFVTFLDL